MRMVCGEGIVAVFTRSTAAGGGGGEQECEQCKSLMVNGVGRGESVGVGGIQLVIVGMGGGEGGG
jgi:hypothetical protein